MISAPCNYKGEEIKMKSTPPVPNRYIDNIEAFRKAKKIWIAWYPRGPREYLIKEFDVHDGWFLRPWDGALFDNYWDAWAYHLKLKQWEKENGR